MNERRADEAAERRRLYNEAFEQGRIAGQDGIGQLADDIDHILSMIRSGQKTQALAMAAELLWMSTEELFELLPSKTTEGLQGYLEGLVAGQRDKVGRIQKLDEERRGRVKRRRLYG